MQHGKNIYFTRVIVAKEIKKRFTIAVMKPSIVQNCESSPIRSNIRKKRQAQIGAPGSWSIAEGYARKANPGPEAATSATGRPCSWAIKPTTEKITKPANILVEELTAHTIRASLYTLLLNLL